MALAFDNAVEHPPFPGLGVPCGRRNGEIVETGDLAGGDAVLNGETDAERPAIAGAVMLAASFALVELDNPARLIRAAFDDIGKPLERCG
jgi:hypothetical protein